MPTTFNLMTTIEYQGRGVAVGVRVGVRVGVAVGVEVRVAVAVGVGVGGVLHLPELPAR